MQLPEYDKDELEQRGQIMPPMPPMPPGGGAAARIDDARRRRGLPSPADEPAEDDPDHPDAAQDPSDIDTEP